MYKSVKSSAVVFSGFLALVASIFVPISASASVGCTSADTVMYLVAHQDDALLFQNPSMQHDIAAGKCVTTVFLTAGEAGRDSSYWLAREDGSKAASAHMAGVADAWTLSDAGVAGRSIPLFTLTANPKISLVFLRLPDGGIDGSGFTTYSLQSLQKLWIGTIPTLTSDDGVNSYSRQGLINTLNTLMSNTNPSRINTQDFVGTFGDGDHSDHHATGFFSKSAHDLYNTPHTFYSYIDYATELMPINVFGSDLENNESAFFAYTPNDIDACQSVVSCVGAYLNWLKREYTNANENGGDICPNIAGKQTSVPEGKQLVNNQCVSIDAPACESDVSNINVVSDTTNSVSSGGFAVETFASSTWTANIPGATWIWNAFHVTDPSSGETLTFTKEVTIVGTPVVGSMTIAADDNYEASINGSQFASVSDINNYAEETKDTYDVSSLIHEGVNTVTVTVHNIAMETTDPETNPAGLRYNLSITKNSCTVPPQACPEGTTGEYPSCTPIDVCSNIEDAQTTVPEGMILSEGQCVPTPASIPPPTSTGGSADFVYWGCTNQTATNYNSLANKDDGSCQLSIGGTGETGGGSSQENGSGNSTSTGEVLGASTTTPELALPAGCTEYIHTYMGKGKKNDKDDVSRLQTFLNETMGSNIPVTGYFGNITKNWAKKFQAKYHDHIIKPWYDAGYKGRDIENGTGYVYKTTKREINLMKCSELSIPLPDLSSDL